MYSTNYEALYAYAVNLKIVLFCFVQQKLYQKISQMNHHLTKQAL